MASLLQAAAALGGPPRRGHSARDRQAAIIDNLPGAAPPLPLARKKNIAVRLVCRAPFEGGSHYVTAGASSEHFERAFRAAMSSSCASLHLAQLCSLSFASGLYKCVCACFRMSVCFCSFFALLHVCANARRNCWRLLRRLRRQVVASVDRVRSPANWNSCDPGRWKPLRAAPSAKKMQSISRRNLSTSCAAPRTATPWRSPPSLGCSCKWRQRRSIAGDGRPTSESPSIAEGLARQQE
eukprot:GHVT01048412.1.p1 GENE.GHVT01048412.1~~GHVT01048412.1.p1  ORF type:complete len:239 (-),score=41.77 GHVT01048412.1:21-737(-)